MAYVVSMLLLCLFTSSMLYAPSMLFSSTRAIVKWLLRSVVLGGATITCCAPLALNPTVLFQIHVLSPTTTATTAPPSAMDNSLSKSCPPSSSSRVQDNSFLSQSTALASSSAVPSKLQPDRFRRELGRGQSGIVPGFEGSVSDELLESDLAYPGDSKVGGWRLGPP